jgi:predicted Rdx family selenoprotein
MKETYWLKPNAGVAVSDRGTDESFPTASCRPYRVRDVRWPERHEIMTENFVLAFGIGARP